MVTLQSIIAYSPSFSQSIIDHSPSWVTVYHCSQSIIVHSLSLFTVHHCSQSIIIHSPSFISPSIIGHSPSLVTVHLWSNLTLLLTFLTALYLRSEVVTDHMFIVWPEHLSSLFLFHKIIWNLKTNTTMILTNPTCVENCKAIMGMEGIHFNKHFVVILTSNFKCDV